MADIVLLWPVWLRPIWFVVDMVAPPFNLAHPVDCRKTIVWPRCRSLQQTDGFHVTNICECLLVTLAITDAVWFCSHEVLSSPGCPCIISYCTDTGLGRHLYYHTVTSSRVEGDGDCRCHLFGSGTTILVTLMKHFPITTLSTSLLRCTVYIWPWGHILFASSTLTIRSCRFIQGLVNKIN